MNVHSSDVISETTAHSDKPVFLQCPPDYYELREPHPEHGHANEFEKKSFKIFDNDRPAFRRTRTAQYKQLQKVLLDSDSDVVEVEPIEGQLDQVFTADQSISLVTPGVNEMAGANFKAITMLSRFTNEHREPEVNTCATYFERNMPLRPLIRSYHRFEGSGDTLYDSFRDMYWSGYNMLEASLANAASGRSDQRAHFTLSGLTGVEVVSLGVQKPFFHMDTSLAPLSGGHMIAYEHGMQPQAYEKMLKNAFDRFGMARDEYLIPVDKDDADAYACNLVCIDKTVIMTKCSKDLQDRITKKGYNVVTTDMSHFIFAGGAMHCLTNNINQQRIVGGMAARHGFVDSKRHNGLILQSAAPV